MDIEVLMKKGKRGAATYLQSECARSSRPESLHSLLDNLLDPLKSIDDWEAIEWCRWVMAGGCTPDEFTATVRRYDNATTCGLVWTANFVAYRCRTCGISPCMSLCAECFKRGNHKGHDFNMFKSQAGGACDCGDTNVMKESGFCHLHGPHAQSPQDSQGAPSDLLCVANAMMPRLILRLIQFMRQNSSATLDIFLGTIQAADKFIQMLHEMSSMGAAMRQVMTNTLTNPQIYKMMTEVSPENVSPAYYEFMQSTRKVYLKALDSLPNPECPEEYKDIPSLQRTLVHKTFLEEFVFWTAKFEFPQQVVCLLLNLLPDADYKEAFTRAFVLHYSRISQLLVRSSDSDTLSNRVVHVSVQLFSNEKLAVRMTEQMGLLHVMVISLKYMMSQITKRSEENNAKTTHLVVDCANPVMKDHCYWPLVSDLNNLLSHRPVAMKFLEDNGLLKMWFNFLSMFQGMNMNQREMNQHVEFEPNTYYAAFSAELEASASPMWALVSHLKDSSTANLTKNLLLHCRAQLREWLDSVGTESVKNDTLQVSFHLPLHRYFAVFLYQAVKNQGLCLADLLPPSNELISLVYHPLRVQTAFYEIISGMWVRNGLQIKGQAMTYIQCHFCNSMVDADLFLLQVAMMNLPKGNFFMTVFDKFHLLESLSLSTSVTNSYLEPDQELLMMENCLIFLATLASVRTAIGMTESDLVSLEMITLLCMSDKPHSQLMELMPERCGNSSQSRDFEAVLSRVADYRAPNFESSGNMLQGMYAPKSFVWESLYDPIYILLRAVHRREFQTSLDRFTEFAKQTGRHKGSSSPWPPFRIPANVKEPYTDPRELLLSKVFQGILFVIFHKAVHTSQLSDQLVSLAVYLLELALSVCTAKEPMGISTLETNYGRYDMDFPTWYSTDCLLENLRTAVDSVLIKGIGTSNDVSVDEMEVEYYEGDMDMNDYDGNGLASITSADYPMAEPGYGQLDLAIINRMLEGDTEERTPTLRQRGLQVVLVPPKPLTIMDKREMVEGNLAIGDSQPVELIVNESIISLLLKLHSKFSSNPDSYVPFWESPEAAQIIQESLTGVVDNGLAVEKEDIIDPITGLPDVKVSYSNAQLYSILQAQKPDSRIGDGEFFIKKILDNIGSKDDSCREHIMEVRETLWPKKCENEEETRKREEREKEEKRRKARERREKLMADFAKQQQKFMEKAMTEEEFRVTNDPPGVDDSFIDDNSFDSDHMSIRPIEYDCVICNQTSPSTQENPVGLVILLQASSTLGHRRKAGAESPNLPTSDDESTEMASATTMTSLNKKRLEMFKVHFEASQWLLSISAGWEGGVHVQTCGHHLHHDCLKGYLAALKSQQRQQNISIERGEYFCPFCRQLANSFLPLSPEYGIRKGALVKDRKVGEVPTTPEATVPEIPPSHESIVALEVVKLLREYPCPTVPSKMMDAMAKTMEEMTNATQLKYRQVGSTTHTKSILLFLNSIARTNLELEIVLRNGSLVHELEPQPSTSMGSSPSAFSRRSCIVPLLHVIGFHYKILSTDPCTPKIWERVLGIRFLPDTELTINEPEVPMLLRDPSSILLLLLLQLPMHVDLAYFTSMVQGIYNLVYVQILAAISLQLREKEREDWKSKTSLNNTGDIYQFYTLFGTVIRYLEKSPVYIPDADLGDMDNNIFSRKLDLNEETEDFESHVQGLLLPFLRIASLLHHHIYEQELPKGIDTPEKEFGHLAHFLGLGIKDKVIDILSESPDQIRAHNFLQWISPTPLTTIWTWCQDLTIFIGRAQMSARYLIETHHVLWAQPKLMELPSGYEGIFQYYHRKPCQNCKSVPKEPNICLVCGQIVCMRDSCCKTVNTGICEAIQHSIDCGAGTAMFLSINSSTIVVVRGRRACLWGSVYLDSFGEEDRDLKRGKPLFLSKDRYALLQQQWVTHRFDHTNRKWVWHRDNL